MKKRCYSCFRIPSIITNPKTGTLHAFAEARRGDVDGGRCPDVPDTRLAYKRSTDGGESWSPLKILFEVEGRCRSQPTPVMDSAVNKLILAFNDGCSRWTPHNLATPHLTVSTDDGLSWAAVTPLAVASPGSGNFGNDVVIGLSRGLALYNESLPSKTRLILPAETGTLYSDDHGASWTAVPDNAIGEGAIARCTPGACGGAPGGRARFAMAVRGGPRGGEQISIKFSNDSLHWTRPIALPDITPFSNYSQAPGLVAIPGGLIMSHGGKGRSVPASQLGGHGDGNGCDLFESVDGLKWTLKQHVWPFQTGYTTMVETFVDNDGGALEFGLLIESGGVMESDQMLNFLNFSTTTTPVPPRLTPPPMLPPLRYHPVPRQLPNINGSLWPGWQSVFETGECDADDVGSPGYGPHHIPGADGGYINVNKRCYSCFRIPSIITNPKTGTLHAFAEARRGDVDGSNCPDIPDARLAYKRSTDGGESWSPLKILAEVEGRCRSQPTPVMDNVTGKLLLAFNDGCNDFSHGNPTTPHIITSVDDGLNFGEASPLAVASPGSGNFGNDVVIGLSRGLALYNESLPSKTRLILPAETGTLYSDDHGASWTAVPDNAIGEGAIARCTPGACGGAPGGRARFAMAVRGGPRGGEQISIKFSNDSLHWTRPIALPDITPFSNYSQAPGLVAIPGGLIMSHGGKGRSVPASQLGGHGDGNGCDLFESVDGLKWTLKQHVWPFQTGYTTMVETFVDNDGGALEFGLLIESGGVMESDQMLSFLNFTVS